MIFASPTVTLIVCPTSVLATWTTEITKHVQGGLLERYCCIMEVIGLIYPAALKFHDVIERATDSLSNEFEFSNCLTVGRQC